MAIMMCIIDERHSAHNKLGLLLGCSPIHHLPICCKKSYVAITFETPLWKPSQNRNQHNDTLCMIPIQD